MRLISLVRLRVDRLHVAVDHLHDAAQLGDFVHLVLILRFLQASLMAVDAADLHLDFSVRDLGDVGVALDALPLAMHAAFETIYKDRWRSARSRRRRGLGAPP